MTKLSDQYKKLYQLRNFINTKGKSCPTCSFFSLMNKIKQESGIFFIEYSRIKKSKYRCHPPLHSPIFCHHYLKLLSSTLQKFTNWILLSPPPLSSDPDHPPKFGTFTRDDELVLFRCLLLRGCTLWRRVF